jgi:hypothetical protein
VLYTRVIMSATPFECPICFEEYGFDNIPTTLPCGHSLCIAHVVSLPNCVICRARVPAAESLHPSYALRDGAVLYFASVRSELTSVPREPPITSKSVPAAGASSCQKLACLTPNVIESIPAPSAQPAPSGPSTVRPATAAVTSNSFRTTPSMNASACASASTTTGTRRNCELKKCGHECSVSSLKQCCGCMDQRPMQAERTYPAYLDGVGWVNNANRNAGYCPICKPCTQARASVPAAAIQNATPQLVPAKSAVPIPAAPVMAFLSSSSSSATSAACSVSAVRAAGAGNNVLGFSSMFRSFSRTRSGSSSPRSRPPNNLTPSSSVPCSATKRNDEVKSSSQAVPSQTVGRRTDEVKSCGHRCCTSSLRKCCSCMDQRPMRREGTYPSYLDGVGWSHQARRNVGYCPVCKS